MWCIWTDGIKRRLASDSRIPSGTKASGTKASGTKGSPPIQRSHVGINEPLPLPPRGWNLLIWKQKEPQDIPYQSES